MAAISIIVPIYNKKRYLKNMLRNLVCQSFSDFECILIDDGSTDGSPAICDKIAQEDARFQVRHIPNGGVSHARNVGLDIATGAYITFIDGDDSIPDNYLSVLYDSVTKQKADLAVCAAWKVLDSGKRKSMPLPGTGLCTMESFLHDFARIQKETGIWGYAWGKMFSRQLAGDIRFDESICLAEDFDFYLRLYPRVHRICFTDQTGYEYLQFAQASSSLVEDSAIDYRAQLAINLRYRSFLGGQGVYTGENRQIVSQLLSNYVYFTLFYCDKEKMNTVAQELRETCISEKIVLHGRNSFEKWILLLLRQGHIRLLRGSLGFYRGLRRLLRRR